METHHVRLFGSHREAVGADLRAGPREGPFLLDVRLLMGGTASVPSD
jgi:hypothetical protein